LVMHKTVMTPLADLKPHPRNYKTHPPDQLAHIEASIREHGFYRNIVVARDGTILAGHGVVEASTKMGLTEVPVIRLDIGPDDPAALKVITGDNEIGRRAEVDDRALTELLKDIGEQDDLLGTGFDEAMLANLLFVTRPQSEIEDMDAAAEWAGAGMPDYSVQGEKKYKAMLAFDTEEERAKFLELVGAEKAVNCKKGLVLSFQYPFRYQRNDWSSVKFEDTGGEDASAENRSGDKS
jgi:hypothetical protein